MATRALPSPHILDDDSAPATRRRKPALLQRLFDAMIEAQARRARREIERALGPDGLARLQRDAGRAQR